MLRITWTMILISLTACEKNITSPNHSVLIPSRDHGNPEERYFLYTTNCFPCWYEEPLSSQLSLSDTTIANSTLSIVEGDQKIIATIHTFPFETEKERIPPILQVKRWENQFEQLNPFSQSISTVSYGGFYGLRFEGEGIYKGETIRMIGWAMSVAPIHLQKLELKATNTTVSQKKGDFTIKVMGPPQLVKKYHNEIEMLAEHFRLIEAFDL